MREDIKLKRYRLLHKKIGEKYCTEFKTVKQSCKECGITPALYYIICKELNKRSVNEPRANTKKNKKQRGGSINEVTEESIFDVENEQKGSNNDINETNNIIIPSNIDKKNEEKHNSRSKRRKINFNNEKMQTGGDVVSDELHTVEAPHLTNHVRNNIRGVF